MIVSAFATVPAMGKAMSPEEFAEKMEWAFSSGDTEEDHIHADFIMCEVLRQLGYSAGVEVFHSKDKWYS